MKAETLGIKLSKDKKYADWLRECYNYSRKGNHPSTHNAALLIKKDKVILRGLNILPPGVKETRSRFTGKEKHIYLNHAERDVIFKAAKAGIKTKELTMVMPWLPCINCANAIITAGIKKLIVHRQMIERTDKKWVKELKNAMKILTEAKVKVIAYDGVVGAKAYMHSHEWDA